MKKEIFCTQSELLKTGKLPEPDGIPIPNDLVELSHLPKLIDKIPVYIKKMTELAQEIENFSKYAMHEYPVQRSIEIENLIYRAFFIELENRSYDIKCISAEETECPSLEFEMRRIRWGEVISGRNPACEICGENRSVDKCHIIPAKLGGTINSDNIIILCPTHHRLFDRYMLSKSEYAAIKWFSKSKPSQYYAENTILENHKKFWNRLKYGINSPMFMFEKTEWHIYKYTLEQILNLFSNSVVISKRSIFKILDHNIQEIAKGIIKILIKKGVLAKNENGKILTLIDWNYQATDETAIMLWQVLN